MEKNINGVLVNRTEKCIGLWTRVNTKNKDEKSILDYVITNMSVYEDINRMVVDEEETYKLTKYMKKGPIETDHNKITLEIKDELEQINKNKEKQWNLNKEGGWEKL